MTSPRKVVILALAAYLAIVIGADFHFHSDDIRLNKLQCNLCQVSNVSINVSAACQIGPHVTLIELASSEISPYEKLLFVTPESKRAPPA